MTGPRPIFYPRGPRTYDLPASPKEVTGDFARPARLRKQRAEERARRHKRSVHSQRAE